MVTQSVHDRGVQRGTQTGTQWLRDAVLYQIYPQTFADSNADGIGDLPGIVQHLDHLAWLGVDTVWLSPCFESPFEDAGYDVSDYFTVAPRYGSNHDLAELVAQAGRRGIRVLLDLVVGHTSDRHPWFRAAADDPADDRYVWSPEPIRKSIPSPGRRGGYFVTNFLPCQPALNFGYARPDPAQPWRQSVDAPGPRANVASVRDVMRHWLALGVAVRERAGRDTSRRLWFRRVRRQCPANVAQCVAQ